MASEESKSEAEYVNMDRGVRPVTMGKDVVKVPVGLDDPNLSQEDKDLRLAIALQQEENQRATTSSKKKLDAAKKANTMRTGRSGVHSRLAAVRDKDHGMLSVPSSYETANAYQSGDYAAPGSAMNMASLKGALPQEVADHNLAIELQKIENSSAGTAQAAAKLTKTEQELIEAQEHRTARSGKQAFHKVTKTKK